MLALVGEMVIVAGAPGVEPPVTVTAAVPLFPPAAAVMVADPEPIAFARPVESMVTTALLELDQLTFAVIGAPEGSVTAAVNCPVCPTVPFTAAGETVTAPTTSWAMVEAVATFESTPKTAFWFKVPRYATAWN
jgi:hypothetical protein